jgi:hypothetical protein
MDTIDAMRELESKGNCPVKDVLSARSAAEARAGIIALYRKIHGTPEPREGANTLHLSDMAKQPFPWMKRFVLWLITEFTQSEVYGLYERLYGNKIAFPLNKCIVRYQGPHYTESYLPYHQDIDSSKQDVHIMNCWTALDHCGDDAPGLEIINAPLKEVQHDLFLSETLTAAGEQRWNEQDAAVIARLGSYGVSRPTFKPGDGLVFDHLAMHKTYFTKKMTKPRVSTEFRACNADEFVRSYGDIDRITVERTLNGLRFSYSATFDRPSSYVPELLRERIFLAIDQSLSVVGPTWMWIRRLRG